MFFPFWVSVSLYQSPQTLFFPRHIVQTEPRPRGSQGLGPEFEPTSDLPLGGSPSLAHLDLPHVPWLLRGLSFLCTAQPMEGRGAAAGSWGAANGWAHTLRLQQLWGQASRASRGRRTHGPLGGTAVEVVVAVGPEQNSGCRQRVGEPPPAVGVGRGLSEGDWWRDRERG